MKALISSFVVAGVCLSSTACRKPPAAQATGTKATTGQSSAAGQAPPPAKPVPAQLPDVVARVNGETVTKSELEHMLRSMEMRAGQPIPADRRDEIVRGSLDQLIVYHLLIQESRTRNVQVSDSEISAQIQRFRGQFQSDEAFKQALAQRGWASVDALQKDIRNDLTVNKLIEADAAMQPAVTEQDARDFYTKNPDQFKQPEMVRASHILIRVEPNADAASRKKARAQIEDVLKKARAGADFAALARQYSQDGSAKDGGDLDYFPHDKMVAPFADAAFALKPGQISGVVESQFGYHIIKVTDRKAARTVPFEEVGPRVREGLSQQRAAQRRDAFVDDLKKKAKIEVLI